jgi:hypothetical protein
LIGTYKFGGSFFLTPYLTCKNKTKSKQHDLGGISKQDKTRHDTTYHDTLREDNTRQDKTRQDETRRDKARQDKTRLKAFVSDGPFIRRIKDTDTAIGFSGLFKSARPHTSRQGK